jgi:hypothetical protein
MKAALAHSASARRRRMSLQKKVSQVSPAASQPKASDGIGRLSAGTALSSGPNFRSGAR